MIIEVQSEQEMRTFGHAVGELFVGGEVLELVGDVGAGKTTFVKGLASGLGVQDEVQSPSFTISRTYDAREGLQLVHYDFYRLQDPGIMADELREMTQDPTTITVIEWADIVEGALPEARHTIAITSPSETSRRLEVSDELAIRLSEKGVA